MRKNIFGRQFKRDRNERKALFKSLMSSFILQGRIQTSEEKAKAIKGQLEKLVTKAKRKGESSRKFVDPFLSPAAADRLITDIAPTFLKRPGGYTRLIRMGSRLYDNASMVMMEWVEDIRNSEIRVQKPDKKSKIENKETKIIVQRKNKTIVRKETKKPKKSSKKS